MPYGRKYQVNIDATPYYHCVSRCIRRSYLCGEDKQSGKNFEHRKEWVEKRLMKLEQAFSIDICSYAIMSNHTHLVLHVNTIESDNLSDIQIIQRWHSIFKGNEISRQYLNPVTRQKLNSFETDTIKHIAMVFRKRLRDISWFMRSLNENIARKANAEDECTGRFWEGRFKSQALLGQKAVITCMAYVDLNPIRASIADTLEKSRYTSINHRLCRDKLSRNHLKPFRKSSKERDCRSLPITFADYIGYLKSGIAIIRQKSKSKLEKLMKDDESHKTIYECEDILICHFESNFDYAVGNSIALREFKRQNGMSRIHGIKKAKRYFDK